MVCEEYLGNRHRNPHEQQVGYHIKMSVQVGNSAPHHFTLKPDRRRQRRPSAARRAQTTN
jgi:hypothetical protein